MSGSTSLDHAWLPRATCDADCLRAGGYEAIRNLPGVLVVSDHMSWLDILTIGAALPSSRWRASPLSFVARADVAGNVAVRMMARIVKVIAIERARLRQLPEVVATVAARLYAGHTVVAFPEGTTWCGRQSGLSGRTHQGSGPFYPAMFQAAVDTGRPVQPLRLRYQHRDGQVSTVPAYVGDDTLLRSIGRLMVARRTVARIYVESLQLPGNDRRELARRCQAAIRITSAPHPGHGQRSSVLAS
jgi:1-acyl-sn-glycerol-3-phosphate acyltransferase